MTIYDIARMAGVSASTVSRVINGKPGVGEKKRQEILDLLENSNYTPDINARNLVNQSTHTIGILIDDIDSRNQSDGLSRAENEIMKNGFFCFTKYIGKGADALENGIRGLAENKVDGALLMGVSFMNHDLLKQLIVRYLKDTPIVLVHQTHRMNLDNVYCIGASERVGFERCVNRLAARGRKNIVLFVDRNRFSRDKICSYFETALERYPDISGWVYTDIEATVSGGKRMMRHVLMDHPQVDAVLSAHDGIAIGAMYECMDQGRKVPEDVSVIGEANTVMCEACRPRLSSLDTMLSMSSPMAARMLIDVLKGSESAKKIIMEMELVERETI